VATISDRHMHTSIRLVTGQLIKNSAISILLEIFSIISSDMTNKLLYKIYDAFYGYIELILTYG